MYTYIMYLLTYHYRPHIHTRTLTHAYILALLLPQLVDIFFSTDSLQPSKGLTQSEHLVHNVGMRFK